MDELQLVREYFTQQPGPAPEVVAAAKSRLTEPPRRLPLPSRRFAVRAGLPLTVIGTAAAVAAAVAFPAHPPAARPPAARPPAAQPPALGGLPAFSLPPGALGPGPADATASGREILLTAAQKVSGASGQRTGRYWVTPAVVGNFVRVGPAGDPYEVLEKIETQYWAAQNPHDGSPSIWQPLEVQLASPADRAAWRRDGSPTVWRDAGEATSFASPQGATNGSFLDPLSAGPGEPSSLSAGYGLPPFLVGTRALTLSQLQKLPADPVRLKQLLMAAYQAAGSGERPDAYLLEAIPPILEMPVTPAVRSGLYRLLAGLSGVQSLGVIRDVTGQLGDGVSVTGQYTKCGLTIPDGHFSFQWDFSSCTVQQILVISPVTGLPLAEELRYVKLPPGSRWSPPGGLFSYEVFRDSYWTNHNRPR
jgi:hypothetical protein